jgi:hypothetical protein
MWSAAEAEPLIYRAEVTAIFGALSDIVVEKAPLPGEAERELGQEGGRVVPGRVGEDRDQVAEDE